MEGLDPAMFPYLTPLDRNMVRDFAAQLLLAEQGSPASARFFPHPLPYLRAQLERFVRLGGDLGRLGLPTAPVDYIISWLVTELALRGEYRVSLDLDPQGAVLELCFKRRV